MQRWATFDCYGTLVDWNAGIGAELERVVGGDQARLLARYHELEPQVQARDPALTYREVMAQVLEALARERGQAPGEADRDALGRSLAGWPVFPDVPGALREMRERGWRLAILSNSDRDLIEASMQAIGVRFDLAVAASEIGSYKPAHRHWQAFFERTGADRAGHVHVAQSHFHDVVPASELGLRSIWINRLGQTGDPPPTRELADLSGLAAAAEELVPG
ncbi:MAG: 2-haloacid dehalogenase [Miltoncostaeaceae bacterium]|jgi:2-haloacid dehalogenase|nr:2-haloacid dehalogenase [Miltoncostaeaceae bacterium]